MDRSMLPNSAANAAPAQRGSVALSITKLRKAFGGQVVLDDVSVELHQGEIVLLRGDNGAGKTTLLNILTGNLNADSGTIETSVNSNNETFHFPAPWWTNLNPFNHFTPERLSREGIGRMWQEVRLFNSLTLRDNISVAQPDQIGENPAWALLRGHTWQQQEKQTARESEAMLSNLGLSGLEDRGADKISLGQSKRVAIARAIEAGAKILFLDEPLSGLDAIGMKEVLALLKQLTASGKVTLVIVEHIFNIPHILNIATTVWTLNQGTIHREAPTAVQCDINKSSTEDFQQVLQQFVTTAGCVSNASLAQQAVLSTIVPPDSEQRLPVLEVKDLVVHRGTRLIIGETTEDGTIRGVSFKLCKGQVAVLHAPNGWGKTTLLEAIAGLLPISGGQILLNGKSVASAPAWQRAKLGLSLLRSRDNCFPTLTVGETLALSGISKVPDSLKIFAKRRIGALSGGERQRVLAASTLSKDNFTLALLDEPFSALDPARVEELSSMMLDKVKQAALLIAVPATLQNRKY